AGTIHADLAVVVHRHEGEAWVDGRVDDGEVQAVAFADRLPVTGRGPAQRIDADLDAGRLDGVHVDDVAQVVDVGRHVIVLVSRARLPGRLVRDPLDAGVVRPEQVVGPVLNPGGDVCFGGAAVGRVVLEAAVGRGVVRRRDHDAVGEVVL